MSPSLRLGFAAALGAYTIWGLLPLYFRALDHVSPDLMLAHRILWSLPTGAILIAVALRWQEVRRALFSTQVFWLVITALLIGGNWLLYIWAVSENRVMEASLGYYVNPLVNVAIGAVFLSETLRRMQWVAVGLAALGVAIETVALGHLPWISLVLCFTFAGYSIIRKQLKVDGRVGFLVEVIVLAPAAAIWMWMFAQAGNAIDGGGSTLTWALLAASGPITATPLILFALAAKRLRLSTIGMMQYIGPTLQFIIALAFGEAFTLLHAVAFLFIWSALAVFSLDSFRFERSRRAARRAAALPV